MGKKFAVFDIDGTIVRWQLFHALSDALIRSGHFKEKDFRAAKDARMAWKRRTGRDAYDTYENTLVRAYEGAIRRVPRDEFLKVMDEAFDEYKRQTYTYTRNLIRKLRKEGYLLFAISASPQEIVKRFAAFYGFDDFGGSVYQHKNNYFTGENTVLKREEKPRLLRELVKKHEGTFSESYAVGDSESDIPMLETVARPIAFNPTGLLLKHAQDKGWKIVIERKNVVYELTKGDKEYAVTTSVS
ncbi:MAG: HAD family phosphatase [Candidatus Saccharibacteria bacterium]|nr:HAD family phosphatase [Candidatus Saccharibacteria bacterium]